MLALLGLFCIYALCGPVLGDYTFTAQEFSGNASHIDFNFFAEPANNLSYVQYNLQVSNNLITSWSYQLCVGLAPKRCTYNTTSAPVPILSAKLPPSLLSQYNNNTGTYYTVRVLGIKGEHHHTVVVMSCIGFGAEFQSTCAAGSAGPTTAGQPFVTDLPLHVDTFPPPTPTTSQPTAGFGFYANTGAGPPIVAHYNSLNMSSDHIALCTKTLAFATVNITYQLCYTTVFGGSSCSGKTTIYGADYQFQVYNVKPPSNKYIGVSVFAEFSEKVGCLVLVGRQPQIGHACGAAGF
eukprot:TRINITY_DN45928_c0_g1_i1.p1 TRINITY_DN45928_c0_g1~~TRINITY_DN45928_c0_g1_i1.p1  ORF type:complete len:294 (-),score=37.94 TRINITY_DN45928_c0_g1_i1:35-916(-)